MDESHEKPPITQREVNPASEIELPREILPLKGDEFESLPPKFKTLVEQGHFKLLRLARVVGNRRRSLWNLLVSTVERSGYKPPQGRQTIILDLGCGKCEEGIVLSAFFGGGKFGKNSENVKFYGVDIDQEAIEHARKNCSILDFSGEKIEDVLPDNFEFIVGDATKLDQYQQIPKEVDVAVIRHHQASDNEAVWTNIIKQALERVSKEGIVIITSLSDTEHKKLINVLQKLDCEIVIDEKNQWDKSLGGKKLGDKEDGSTDRHIAIIRKKNLPPSSAEPSNPAKTE